MKLVLSFLPSLLTLLVLSRVRAFAPGALPRISSTTATTMRRPVKTKAPSSAVCWASAETAPTETETDHYFRAIECANGALSSIDELDRLASELEGVDGCKFEDDGDEVACETEIQDRLDVAHMLRLRIELQIRKDHLNQENLFASDVKKRHDVDERRRFKEMIQANRDKVVSDGSDLGLW